MSKSNNKGSSFERKICRVFSLWWSRGKRDDIFWRTSQSGGRAKIRSRRSKKTFGQYGDIQAVDPIGSPLFKTVVIELKKGYNKCSFMDILDKKDTSADQIYESFLSQVKEDKQNAGVPYFLLITQRDRRAPIVTLPRMLYYEIEDKYGCIRFEYCPFVVRMRYMSDTLIVCRLYDFLKWAKPKFFINRQPDARPRQRQIIYK